RAHFLSVFVYRTTKGKPHPTRPEEHDLSLSTRWGRDRDRRIIAFRSHGWRRTRRQSGYHHMSGSHHSPPSFSITTSSPGTGGEISTLKSSRSLALETVPDGKLRED